MKEITIKEIDWSIKKWTRILEALKDDDFESEDYDSGNIILDIEDIHYDSKGSYYANCPLCEIHNPYKLRKENKPTDHIKELEGTNQFIECPGCPLEEINRGCLNEGSSWQYFEELSSLDVVDRSDGDIIEQAIGHVEDIIKDLNQVKKDWKGK